MLSALVDDRADHASRHRAERHLAECASCRKLLDEAERAEALLAASLDGSGAAQSLPEGFEAAVLARTVYGAGRRGPGGLTTWLGWMATAASLMLAVSIWVLDWRPGATPADSGVGPVAEGTYTLGPERRSWLHEGDIPPDALWHLVGDRAERQPPHGGSAPGAGDAQVLSRSESETLESAALMLALLQRADAASFTDLEDVRRATEYDDLLERMAAARRTLSPEHRPLVLAAESILYRVVHGPLTLDDARELREAARRLEISRRLGELGSRTVSASAL
jgi:hypothetical protein